MASGRAKHSSNARHHSDPCTCSDGLSLKSVDEIAVGLDVCLQPALLARWPAAQLLRASGIHRSSSVFVLPGARTNRDSQQSKSLRISLKCSWSLHMRGSAHHFGKIEVARGLAVSICKSGTGESFRTFHMSEVSAHCMLCVLAIIECSPPSRVVSTAFQGGRAPPGSPPEPSDGRSWGASG